MKKNEKKLIKTINKEAGNMKNCLSLFSDFMGFCWVVCKMDRS